MSISAAPYNFFSTPRTAPIIALIKEFTKQLPSILFGADFMQGRIIDTATGLEAIRTNLTLEQLPAVGVYEETSEEEYIGIGEYVDEKGFEKAVRYRTVIAMDIWAINNYQRERASDEISNHLPDFRDKMRELGFLDFRNRTSRVRGFDLTDRILQFHSHQISPILRRILFFIAIYEVIRTVKKSKQRLSKFIINSNIDGIIETIEFGDILIPPQIFNEMRKGWC